MINSPIKWVGGKRKLLKQYESLFPKEINNYYEPFMGSATVFFYLKQQGKLNENVFLSDVNYNLVHGFIGIRDYVEHVIQQLEPYENTEKNYELFRTMDSGSLTDVQCAVRLLYLNRTAFNGLWRENLKGIFNVPFGYYKNPKICDPVNLRAVSKLLQETVIRKVNYLYLSLVLTEPNDFVYLDPPYYPISDTRNFTAYSGEKFTEESHIQLKSEMDYLTNRKCNVMQSNSDSPFIRELYKDYNIVEVEISHTVAAKGTSRGKLKELVIRNYG